jgi:hypothetical protein
MNSDRKHMLGRFIPFGPCALEGKCWKHGFSKCKILVSYRIDNDIGAARDRVFKWFLAGQTMSVEDHQRSKIAYVNSA